MAQPNSAPLGENRSDNAGDNSLPFREGDDSGSPPAGPGRDLPERDLLEQIVRRALTEQEGSDKLPPELLSELYGVARGQRDQSQTWEATVPKVIDQVLTSLFSAKLLEPQVRREMAQEIAETLLHDETAAARLRRFWERICEGGP